MHYYGHGSWIALAIFGAVLLVRILSSQRSRDRGPGQGAPGPAQGFTRTPPTHSSASPTQPSASPPDPAPGAHSGTGLAPGWFPDPTGRHGQRYWSGTEWSEHVLDDGVPGTDPPPATPPRRPAV